MCVVVLAVGILHQGQTTLILVAGFQVVIVRPENTRIGFHAGDRSLCGELLAACELRAELSLTEVTGVVEHDVKDDLDTFLVCRIDELLKHHITATAITALIAAVYFREVGSMIAVIVISRSILHDGVDPDSGEAQRLDIVELVD